MADEKATLFLELVTEGVQQTSASLNTVAQRANDTSQAWAKMAASWKQIRSGEFATRAREMALVGREQAKLSEEMRRQTIIATEGKLAGGLRLLQERFQTMGRVGTYAMGLLTVSLGGWIRAGLQGTAEANRMSLAFQQISRAVADAFAPWIQKAIDWLTQLAERFRRLSGEQQQMIRHWVALGAAIAGSMIALPKFLGLLASVAAGFKAVGLARLAALAGPIGLGALAAGGVLASTKGGRESLANLGKALQPLLDALGGLAMKIIDVAGPAIETLAGWLAKGVDALTRFVEALFNIVRTIQGWLGMELEPTLAELRTWVAHLTKAYQENRAELDRIARERTGGALGGEEYLEQQRRRLAALEAPSPGVQKTSVSAAPTGGFEGATDLFRRIAGTAAKTDTQRAADATEQSLAELQKIAAEIARLRGWTTEQAMDRVRALPGAGNL